MCQPRYRDYVPPLPTPDARRLRRLPSGWAEPIVESEVEALERRSDALALALAKRGRRREADELRRRRLLLERADGLHRHASTLETLVGLYRALAVFAGEREPTADDGRVWVQSGAVGDEAPPAGHGPAFRETAALRNRAYHLLAAAIAGYAREVDSRPR
jgi:hypothetical protein